MSDNRRIGFCAVLAAALALISVTTAAANSTRMQFVVSVQVIGSCHTAIQTPATNRKAAIDAIGSIVMHCARNTAYTISLDSAGHSPNITKYSVARVGNGLTQVIPISSRIHNFAGGIVSGTGAHTIMVTITY